MRIQYMSSCASMISNSLPPSPPSPSPTNNVSSPGSSNSHAPSSTSHLYDTSVIHKILAPVSLAVFQPAFLLFRLLSPSDNGSGLPFRHVTSALLLLVAYALGIVGLASSFTTISVSGSASGHSKNLKTGHGIAGLAFFVCFYGIVPGLLILFLYFKRGGFLVLNDKQEAERTVSPDTPTPEKPDSVAGLSTPHSTHNTSPPASPRPRTNSWGPSSHLQDGQLSSDTESFGSAGPSRTFEVVNRPRPRRTSESWLVPLGEDTPHQLTSRTLGDIDWLQRRRRLNAVVSREILFVQSEITFLQGELDYVISQAHRAHLSSTAATADALMTTSMIDQSLYFPSTSEILFRVLFHSLLMGLCVITLIALWTHASRAAFAAFLTWTAGFYIVILTFAWYLRPKTSTLVIICSRLRHRHRKRPPSSHTPLPNPQTSPGPYIHHHPPYHTAVASDDTSVSHGALRNSVTDDHEDSDEDMRQRTIEDEMGRREVSIVTVPKRKLWITNPS